MKVRGEDSGSSLALELTRGDLKLGNGRTPFQILEDFVRTRDPVHLALFHEWERATRGRHFGQWSRGAKADLGLLEGPDEEISGTEAEVEVVFEFTPEQWYATVRTPGALSLVLDYAEREGAAGVAAFVSRVVRVFRGRDGPA